MLFNSFTFIVFFIAVSASYFVLPQQNTMILLLAASCIFYMAWNPKLIILILITIFINYTAALYIYKYKKQREKNTYFDLVY